MKCPYCSHENIAGVSLCEDCGQDLTAVGDGEPTGRLHGAVLDTLGDVGILDPIVIAPAKSVADAVAIMREKRHGSVTVVDEGNVVGIFTERDLLIRVDPQADLKSIQVADVMTHSPRTYQSKTTVSYALNGMAIRGHRHLPIVSGKGALRGFVSVRKLLAHIQRKVDL